MARNELGRKAISTLSSTGRKYLDGTHRARLASPGIEHYPGEKGSGVLRIVVAAAALGAMLVGAMLWYWSGH